MGLLARLRASRSASDVSCLIETTLVVAVTWLVLGATVGTPITQGDGTWLVAPYTQSGLAAGVDWTQHLYRFGVVGGSEMHPFAGTTPLLQLCSALGLSTTTTLNVTTMFLQVCVGVLGLRLALAISGADDGRGARVLSAPERIVAVWLLAFAPVIGWRLAIGHENLIAGLIPLLAALSLLWCARVGTLSVVLVLFGAFAITVGVSGLGAQSLVYGLVFGAPFAIATIATSPRGTRWTRSHGAVLAAVVGAVLVMLPRLASMIEHALGPDATRGLDASVTYSYGEASARDWLASIPWTVAGQNPIALHERNYALGPLICFVVALWPRGLSRKLGWVALAVVALAILFASNIAPISTTLLDALPPLRAFRVPARSVLPILVLVPSLALAAWWSCRPVTPLTKEAVRLHWVAIVLALVVIVSLRGRVPAIRELLAWITCALLVYAARWWPEWFTRRSVPAALALVAALGVLAFEERIPRGVPIDPIENGPRQLRDAVQAEAGLRSAPDRIEIIDAPPPYEMSAAFAAGLPSLDGMWYPPRRFLELLSAIQGKPLPATVAVFKLGRTRPFRILQQLYNVRFAIVGLGTEASAVQSLPPTPGPAWFPSRIETIERPDQMIAALRDAPDLRARLLATAWVARAAGPVSVPPGCAQARVLEVTTDGVGQTATLRTESPVPCVLVVATNYTQLLHATSSADGSAIDLPVFPIDIALTGISVPQGSTTITLAPELVIPGWSRIAQLLGLLAIAAACWLVARQRSAVS